MSEVEKDKDDPLRPLPNGMVPHPQDFVLRLDFMNESGMHAGYLRVKALDGGIEIFGFGIADDKVWTQLEKLNPAIVKLCRAQFVVEARANHARRELMNAQEAIGRGVEVLTGRRPVVL